MATQLLSNHDGPSYPDIGRSWLRSRLAGVRPDTTLHDAPRTEVDADHPLLAAARPVLRDLESRIRGSGSQLALIDRTGQLVYRWFEDASTAEQMDDVGVLPGTSFLESAIGTNAMGTALELRKPTSVNGSEHYVEALKPFSCHGRPVFHPLTRRIEGVLDISARSNGTHPRFSYLGSRAVDDIEERLLVGTRSAQRRLFDAFEVAARRTAGALVALGDDTVIANRAAWDLIEPDDLAELRELAARVTRVDTTSTVRLTGGRNLQVRMQQVTALAQGALFHLFAPVVTEASRQPGDQVPPRQASHAPADTDVVLVVGPSGTGRSTLARALCVRTPVTGLSATTALLDGPTTWAQTFMRAWRAEAGSHLDRRHRSAANSAARSHPGCPDRRPGDGPGDDLGPPRPPDRTSRCPRRTVSAHRTSTVDQTIHGAARAGPAVPARSQPGCVGAADALGCRGVALAAVAGKPP